MENIMNMSEVADRIEALHLKALWHKTQGQREVEHLVRQISRAEINLGNHQEICLNLGIDIAEDAMCLYWYNVLKGLKKRLMEHKVVME